MIMYTLKWGCGRGDWRPDTRPLLSRIKRVHPLNHLWRSWVCHGRRLEFSSFRCLLSLNSALRIEYKVTNRTEVTPAFMEDTVQYLAGESRQLERNFRTVRWGPWSESTYLGLEGFAENIWEGELPKQVERREGSRLSREPVGQMRESGENEYGKQRIPRVERHREPGTRSWKACHVRNVRVTHRTMGSHCFGFMKGRERRCKMVWPQWKMFWWFLGTLSMKFSYDPAILLLGIYLK